MLVTSGKNAPTKSMFPARKAGKRAGMAALAIRKALDKCGGSVTSYRKTEMFAQISRTLTMGNRRCGLRSLSGMNTESRGQSNQNGQKDKAWQTPANDADHRWFLMAYASLTCLSHEPKNISLICREREFSLQFSVSMRQTLRARCGCDN